MGAIFPQRSSRLMDLLSQRGKTKKIQLQKMLDYISTKECRRAFLIAYFGETSAGENHNCCDNDGALLKAKPVKQLNSEAHLSGKKLFKKFLKMMRKIEN